jgi:DNA-binding response OmpR family regulator
MRKILFVDNHQEFLSVRTEYLEEAGYQVIPAYSVAEAEQILHSTWVHLAILDIRLEDDLDSEDDSGIRLAKNHAFRHIPKIMLTARPSIEYVRQSMAPALEGLPPAVDFLSKTESPQAMIDSVRSAIARHVKINWDLAFHWSERCPFSFNSIAGFLSPTSDPANLADKTAEIEDLFRRLFFDSEQIAFDYLYWRKPGRIALGTVAYTAGRPDRHLLVTCGLLPEIEMERRNRASLASQVPLPGQPTLVQSAQTLHFGANCFELVNSDLETAKTLEQFYHQSAAREINTVIDRLATSCLGPWHRQRRLASPATGPQSLFRQRLALPPDEALLPDLARKVTGLADEAASAGLVHIDLSPSELVFQTPKGFRYAFPFLTPRLLGLAPLPTAPAIASGSSLGEFSPNTILVDNTGQPWLTDLGGVAEGPLLGDYAALETTFKLDLLDDLASFSDWFELEQILLSAHRLTDRLDPGAQQYAKIVQTVQRIRNLAGESFGNHILPYHWGLLFQALKRLLAYDPAVKHTRRELMPFVHASLCLGMLAGRLSSESPLAEVGLDIDTANRQVRLDGRPLDLSPTDYDILHFLWDNAGNPCSREAIVVNVYGHSYTPGKTGGDDEKLNMAISRLRQKIESNPDRPRYLVTKRAGGYTLFPHGRPQS